MGIDAGIVQRMNAPSNSYVIHESNWIMSRDPIEPVKIAVEKYLSQSPHGLAESQMNWALASMDGRLPHGKVPLGPKLTGVT